MQGRGAGPAVAAGKLCTSPRRYQTRRSTLRDGGGRERARSTALKGSSASAFHRHTPRMVHQARSAHLGSQPRQSTKARLPVCVYVSMRVPMQSTGRADAGGRGATARSRRDQANSWQPSRTCFAIARGRPRMCACTRVARRQRTPRQRCIARTRFPPTVPAPATLTSAREWYRALALKSSGRAAPRNRRDQARVENSWRSSCARSALARGGSRS